MLALCVVRLSCKTYPAPIGPSQSDFSGVGFLLQTPTRVWREKGKSALTIVITTSTATILHPYSCSHGSKPRCATPTYVRKQYSSVDAFSGDQTYKIKPSISKTACGKELLDAAGIRGTKDISSTGLFDASTLSPVRPGGPFDFAGRSLAGAISAPAAT